MKRAFMSMHCYLYLILAVVVIIQLLLPYVRAPFIAKIGGALIINPSATSIEDRSRQLLEQSVHLEVDDASFAITPSSVGAIYDTAATLQQLRYPALWKRFVPFYGVVQVLRNQSLLVSLDANKRDEALNPILSTTTKQPVDARYSYAGGVFSVQADQVGQGVSREELNTALLNGLKLGGAPRQLTKHQVVASTTAADATKHIPDAEAIVARGLALNLHGKDYPIDATTIATWLQPTYDIDTKQHKIIVDKVAATSYFDIAPTSMLELPTKIGDATIRRLTAVRTRAVTAASLEYAISQAVAAGQQQALPVLQFATEWRKPELYDLSQEGFAAFVRDLAARKGDYGIAVQEISGGDWVAAGNGAKSYITASTYKLFVAYSTLSRIEKGTFAWTDATAGTSLSACFDKMIIESNNECAEALGMRIGWQTVFSEMRTLGMASTHKDGDLFSTANDEALFLTKLARGEILSETSRSRLLTVMKKQQYRLGIPAGTGVVVADKVGFLYGLLHDAAIVYDPRGTYVLVILTDGSSWSSLADASNQIHDFLQR